MHTNRLIHEKSPYLLQHAHNPVDWYAWGRKRSRKRAKKTSRFFFPSAIPPATGATSWSANRSKTKQIAAILNENFVAIKVDREERPDVDRIYMTYVQATTGGGGWPMSVWLTPDLKPFVGGTYFPPENRYGRAGFPAMLERIAEAWQRGSREDRGIEPCR